MQWDLWNQSLMSMIVLLLLFQSPGGTSVAAMPPPPYYVANSCANVVLPYPDDLDDDDTDWDRLL